MSTGEKQPSKDEAEGGGSTHAPRDAPKEERERLAILLEDLEDEAIQHLLGIAVLLHGKDGGST